MSICMIVFGSVEPPSLGKTDYYFQLHATPNTLIVLLLPCLLTRAIIFDYHWQPYMEHTIPKHRCIYTDPYQGLAYARIDPSILSPPGP